MAQLVAKDARVGLDIAADAPPLAPAEPVIDRAHLTRMTHGERDLEREVLQLYATQAAVLLGRMLRADAVPSASAAIAALAHTLKGSSRTQPPPSKRMPPPAATPLRRSSGWRRRSAPRSSTSWT